MRHAPYMESSYTLRSRLFLLTSSQDLESIENINLFRTLFQWVKLIIIDEVRMCCSQLLCKVDKKMRNITGNQQTPYGEMDVLLIGDLRHRSRLLQFITNQMLTEEELASIESRFIVKSKISEKCLNAILLFDTINDFDRCNTELLNIVPDKVSAIANDKISGCNAVQEEQTYRQKLHKMKSKDTGNLQYEIVFARNYPYMITLNIDVSEGLSNGTIRTLLKIEFDNNDAIKIVWLIFPKRKIGSLARKKSAAYALQNNIDKRATPIQLRTATVHLNKRKRIYAKRRQFPLRML